ncbi:hypothetical protein BKA62DRAFT_415179 [Auriculariales sp. MPI-PUGE-AT-0066]|nr:hypothetical protein BKA62DRAFT_415179 [Auriculariales sp. MPI-PUGE-AT-0066]
MTANETLYRDLLRKEVDGECMWWPSIRGEVGDCGYIHDTGRFVKFFNVFELPGFGPRPQDPSTFLSETLPSRDVAYGATFSTDATAGAGGTAPGSVTLNLNFSFSRWRQAGAFLQPLGNDRVQETYIRSRRFARYLAKNYKTILEQYGQDCDIQSLLIVKGTVRAPDWCRGLVHSEGSSAQGSLKLQGGAANVGVGLATTATHRFSGRRVLQIQKR